MEISDSVWKSRTFTQELNTCLNVRNQLGRFNLWNFTIYTFSQNLFFFSDSEAEISTSGALKYIKLSSYFPFYLLKFGYIHCRARCFCGPKCRAWRQNSVQRYLFSKLLTTVNIPNSNCSTVYIKMKWVKALSVEISEESLHDKWKTHHSSTNSKHLSNVLLLYRK